MQEKLDHVAIVALIIGTPLTHIMARAQGHVPKDLLISLACMMLCAALPPAIRVAGFVLGPVIWSFWHRELLTLPIISQAVLYLLGAASFLR